MAAVQQWLNAQRMHLAAVQAAVSGSSPMDSALIIVLIF